MQAILNFRKAMDINNDLVVLYNVLSEAEIQTDSVNEIKEKFVMVVEEELKKLQDSKILL
jgi:hypothetical protein